MEFCPRAPRKEYGYADMLTLAHEIHVGLPGWYICVKPLTLWQFSIAPIENKHSLFIDWHVDEFLRKKITRPEGREKGLYKQKA